jgi:hypothetical protein
MNDKLEQFIKSHRADMDDKDPRPDLWIDIANEISSESKQRSLTKSFVWWRAAAILLLFITSLMVIEKFISEPEKREMAMNQQLMEAESFYIDLISQKKGEVITLSEEMELGSDFIQEVNMLDSMYTVLKKDLKNGNEDNLVDAMILNLQLRIEVLNEQLSIIQSIQNRKKENIAEDENDYPIEEFSSCSFYCSLLPIWRKRKN